MRKDVYEKSLEQLKSMDSSTLAEALMDLALSSREADLLRERLLLKDTEELIETFDEYIETIKGSAVCGEEILRLLRSMIKMLDPEKVPAETGIALLEKFYSTDGEAFESTNELDFEFSMIFDRAAELFKKFSSRVTDKTLVNETLKRLAAGDNYGARMNLQEQYPKHEKS